MRSTKKSKVLPFFKYLAIALFIITIITLGLFKFIDVLPGEYYLVLCIFLILVAIIMSVLVLSKSVKKRVIGTILSLIYIIILILGIIYELNTIGFLKKIGYADYKTENYKLIVLNNSKYQKLEDLKSSKIGSVEFTTEGLKEIKTKLENKINPKFITYNDTFALKEDFKQAKFAALLIEDALLAILTEDDSEFEHRYRIIEDFSIDIKTTDIAREVDITKDPFNIFISGIDTYGPVSSVSRSDVNMVITVNPKTHKMLITSIPRDYYVTLGTKNALDKLTHAGIYGIDESIKTIENLLDIKINYYIKVNFTSLIKIVDALGGVDVYSDYNFTSKDGYYYKKGYNHVNGKLALSFVRERKAFQLGDRVRIENQANMIAAMVNKATSASIIVKYNNLLSALSNAFITNIKEEAITDFIKKQIDESPKWEIENYSLDGTDASNYTYSYRGSKLYVMVPDLETVTTAKTKIKALS